MPFQNKENLPVLELDFVPENSISEEEFNSLQSQASPLDQKPVTEFDFVPEGSISEEEYKNLLSKETPPNPASPQDSINHLHQSTSPASPEDILAARTMPAILKAGYDNFSQLPDDAKQQLFNDMARIVLKAPVAGAATVLDFFTTLPKNATAAALNAVTPEGWEAPYDSSYEEAAEKGVDSLANKVGLNTSGGGIAYEGAKLASGVALSGGLAGLGKALTKAPNLLSKGLNFIGSKNPNVIMGAAGAGAAMEAAHENEAGIVKTLGAGLAGGIVAENLPFVMNKKSLLKIGQKGLIKGLGLGKKGLKLDAVESAERLGVDLPIAAVTDNVLTAFVNQAISKLPHLGDKLRTQVKNTSEQFQSAFNNMLDSIAPKLDNELSQQTESIYKIPTNLLKNSKDAVSPSLILQAIEKIKAKIKSPLYSDPTDKLVEYLQKLESSLAPSGIKITLKELPENFLNFSKKAQQQILESIKANTAISYLPIQEALRAKVEINKIMRDKKVFDRKDTDTLSLLEDIRLSIQETLAEYGKTNPKWYQEFKKADAEYGALAKRGSLENVLAEKIVNPITQEVAYAPLVKLLEDRKQRKFFKNNLGEKNYKKLKDFVNVARSMDSAKRNILNPSSTAMVGSVIGFFQMMAFGKNLIPGMLMAGGASGLTSLFINKKFLNMATEFAKTPTVPLAKKINKIVKDHTGVGVQALLHQTQNNKE